MGAQICQPAQKVRVALELLESGDLGMMSG
jgi:hypothetical protein